MVPDHWSPSVDVARWKYEDCGLDVASTESIGKSFHQLGNHLCTRCDPSPVAKFKLLATQNSESALLLQARNLSYETGLRNKCSFCSAMCLVTLGLVANRKRLLRNAPTNGIA